MDNTKLIKTLWDPFIIFDKFVIRVEPSSNPVSPK